MNTDNIIKEQKQTKSKIAFVSFVISIEVILTSLISINFESIFGVNPLLENILGALSWYSLISLGPLSIILGILALSDIKKSSGRLTGKFEAIAGIVTTAAIFLIYLIIMIESDGFFPTPD